jgi:hypothetical protein
MVVYIMSKDFGHLFYLITETNVVNFKPSKVAEGRVRANKINERDFGKPSFSLYPKGELGCWGRDGFN